MTAPLTAPFHAPAPPTRLPRRTVLGALACATATATATAHAAAASAWPWAAAAATTATAPPASTQAPDDPAPRLLGLHADGLAVQLLHPAAAALPAPWPLPQPCRQLLPLAVSGRPGWLAAATDGTVLRLGAGLAARPGPVLAARSLGDAGPAGGPGPAETGDTGLQLAVSANQRWVLAVAPAQPVLHLLDADTLHSVRTWALPGPVAWLADAAHRRAFVLALAGQPALWTLSYDPQAEDFYEGLVHDYRMGEGVPQRGYLNVRRMPLPQPLRAGCLDAEDTEVAGQGWVFNLDARRPVARVPALQPAQAGAAALLPPLQAGGPPLMAVPVAGQAVLALWHTVHWAPAGQVALPWPARQVLRVPPVPAPVPASALNTAPPALLVLGEGGACRLLSWSAPTPGRVPMAPLSPALTALPVPALRQLLRG